MILTKDDLMEFYPIDEQQIQEEVERLKNAAQGELIFVLHKYYEQDRIDTLIAMAHIPYYYGCRCDGPTNFYKGPFLVRTK